MTENNKKGNKHFLIIRTKRKQKKEDYNGIIYYNRNLHIIFKYCMVHTTVNRY